MSLKLRKSLEYALIILSENFRFYLFSIKDITFNVHLRNAKKCIKCLQEMGCQTVIITLGVGGVAFNSGFELFRVPIEITQTAVDTTGAGDCFIGALAHFLAKYPEVDMTQKIAASCVLASHSVTLRGTQISYVNFPTIDFSSRKFAFEEL